LGCSASIRRAPKPCSDTSRPELPGQLALDPGEELRLGHVPALEREQRVLALALGGRGHRGAVLLERDAEAVLEGDEGLQQRGGQHAAEVRDDGLDHAQRRMS